jgi:hypothetical protein
MRPKFQKQSVLKLVGRIIPQSGGFNTSQLAAESVSKACFGVHTRDSGKVCESISPMFLYVKKIIGTF